MTTDEVDAIDIERWEKILIFSIGTLVELKRKGFVEGEVPWLSPTGNELFKLLKADGFKATAKEIEAGVSCFRQLPANGFDELLAACQTAVNVKTLWAPTAASHKDHPEEGAALAGLLLLFEQAIANATKGAGS